MNLRNTISLQQCEEAIQPYMALLKKAEGDHQQSRLYSSSVLHGIFTNLGHNFPRGTTLNVISLCAGVPDEYLALQAFYDKLNIKINFFSVDIDAEQNKIVEGVFAEFSQGFHVITADVNKPEELCQQLKDKKLQPPQGFDFIFLRHPNILAKEYKATFAFVLNTVIPFVASKYACVFLSCYHKIELDAAYQIASNTGLYFKPAKGNNYLSMNNGLVFQQENTPLILNNHSVVLTCDGVAFDEKLLSTNRLSEKSHLAASSSASSHNLSMLKNAIKSPITAHERAHQDLLTQLKTIVSGSETGYKPFLDAIEEKQYSRALRRICAINTAHVIPLLIALLTFRQQFPFDINEQAGPKKYAAIHYGARNTNPEIHHLLIKHGAQVDLLDADNMNGQYIGATPKVKISPT